MGSGMIYSSDGKTVLFTAENPGNVTLTGSTIQLPVDLQDHNITSANPLPVLPVNGSKASGYEAVTVDDTAGGVALTSAEYGTCLLAYISVETAPIRFTIDGTAPTTSVGHLVTPGNDIVLTSNEDIAAFRAIRTGAVSAVIQCTYSSY